MNIKTIIFSLTFLTGIFLIGSIFNLLGFGFYDLSPYLSIGMTLVFFSLFLEFLGDRELK